MVLARYRSEITTNVLLTGGETQNPTSALGSKPNGNRGFPDDPNGAVVPKSA